VLPFNNLIPNLTKQLTPSHWQKLAIKLVDLERWPSIS
jgi:hypothetical protein